MIQESTQNTGNGNAGYWNTGDRNTGYRNAGNRNTGNRNAGNENAGNENAGNENAGNRNAGNRNVGDWNVGYKNVGNKNVGNRNVGNTDIGDWNVGNGNVGDWNVGNGNVGNGNVGYGNVGYGNVGDLNTGSWNTGNRNTGYLNTITPTDYLLFNKPCSIPREELVFPDFFNFSLTEWIPENEMTKTEKIKNPTYETISGYLKAMTYHEAWRESWNKADDEDRKKCLKLPNWDNEIFKEISGIDVEAELKLDKKHDVIEVNGVKYKRIN